MAKNITIALMILAVIFAGVGLFTYTLVYAADVKTTVTVVIGDEISSASTTHAQVWASVPCNEVNCPEDGVQGVVGKISLWQRFLNWLGL